MGNKLADNLILNFELLDRKTFHDKEAGNNQIVNKQDALNLVGTDNLWLSSHLTNTMAVNNASAKPKLYLSFGTSLYSAYLATPKYYIYENSDWDGTFMNEIKAASSCVFYESDNTTKVGTGYLMRTSGIERQYYRVYSGVVDYVGTFTPILYNDLWEYCVQGTYGSNTDDLFGNRSGNSNERKIYFYSGYWYSTWTYESPKSSDRVTATCIRYVNDNLYYYRNISNGVIQSEGYAYDSVPTISLAYNKSSVSVNGETITGTVTASIGTYWHAYISSGSGATISNNTGKVGSGSFTLTFSKNASSARSVTVTVVVDYPNGVIASENVSTYKSVTQSGVSYTNVLMYVVYNYSRNKIELRSNLNSSTLSQSPTNLTVNFTVEDDIRGSLPGYAQISANGTEDNIEWEDGIPTSPSGAYGSVSPNPYTSGTTQYSFEFASDLL